MESAEDFYSNAARTVKALKILITLDSVASETVTTENVAALSEDERREIEAFAGLPKKCSNSTWGVVYGLVKHREASDTS